MERVLCPHDGCRCARWLTQLPAGAASCRADCQLGSAPTDIAWIHFGVDLVVRLPTARLVRFLLGLLYRHSDVLGMRRFELSRDDEAMAPRVSSMPAMEKGGLAVLLEPQPLDEHEERLTGDRPERPMKVNGENAATLFVDVIDDAVDPPLVLEAIGIRHRS